MMRNRRLQGSRRCPACRVGSPQKKVTQTFGLISRREVHGLQLRSRQEHVRSCALVAPLDAILTRRAEGRYDAMPGHRVRHHLLGNSIVLPYITASLTAEASGTHANRKAGPVRAAPTRCRRAKPARGGDHHRSSSMTSRVAARQGSSAGSPDDVLAELVADNPAADGTYVSASHDPCRLSSRHPIRTRA